MPRNQLYILIKFVHYLSRCSLRLDHRWRTIFRLYFGEQYSNILGNIVSNLVGVYSNCSLLIILGYQLTAVTGKQVTSLGLSLGNWTKEVNRQ